MLGGSTLWGLRPPMAPEKTFTGRKSRHPYNLWQSRHPYNLWDTVMATYAAGTHPANVALRPFGLACGYSSCAINRGIGVERVHEHSATNLACVGLAVLRSHGSCLDFPRLGLRVQQCDGDILILSASTWHANSHVGGLRVTSAFYTVRRETNCGGKRGYWRDNRRYICASTKAPLLARSTDVRKGGVGHRSGTASESQSC